MFHRVPEQKRASRFLVSVVAAALLAAPITASAQQTTGVTVHNDAKLGPILTDQMGRTLYLYTKDSPGISSCYDQCATAWPPLLTDEDPSGPDTIADGLGVTARDDGTQQVTYNGMPLYYWAKDAKPGDTTGQNVGGVWFIVNP